MNKSFWSLNDEGVYFVTFWKEKEKKYLDFRIGKINYSVGLYRKLNRWLFLGDEHEL